MGCGRVGSALALRLIELGHSVAIIDKEESAFLALGDDFTGQKVLGVGFDRDTLVEAGIEKAQAFAAVSSGDNSNIVSARVARENFNVPLVVARIYDPRRAKVYERLGIPAAKVRVALISRFGGAILPDRDTVLQEGDLIHAIYQVQDRDFVENVFSSGPKD